MLAKNVNDNACFLDERGDFEFFASKLAPTTADLCVESIRRTKFSHPIQDNSPALSGCQGSISSALKGRAVPYVQ